MLIIDVFPHYGEENRLEETDSRFIYDLPSILWYPIGMKILFDPELLEPYIESEYDSENLDAIINRFYLQHVDEAAFLPLLEKHGAPNAYRAYFLKQMNEDEKEALSRILFGFGLDEIKPTNAKTIESNPYYRALSSLKRFEKGNISFVYEFIPPFELFLSEDKGHDEMIPSQEKTILSYVDRIISIPTLKQNGLTWMSLVPHEIHTMEKPIDEATGNVLVYGVGLGYYAYMVARKKDVKSITIIEKDHQILSLFKERFLPLFEGQDKISLIEADALAYQERRDIHYDYCFVDIYRGESDGFPLYASLKASEGIADKTSYWIEGALLCYLRRHLCVMLEELFFQGYTEEDYQNEDDPSSLLLKRCYEASKDVVLHDEDELRYFLSDHYLREFVKKLHF